MAPYNVINGKFSAIELNVNEKDRFIKIKIKVFNKKNHSDKFLRHVQNIQLENVHIYELYWFRLNQNR